MANILKIVQAGHPVLRQKARPLTIDEIRSPDTARIIDEMRETMRDA
ncbi:MAG: peptide deformylase, partial [Deltaproteobacteria bacterium]|nr:peptide deformylase [Deltaproteobacteria bacterium]